MDYRILLPVTNNPELVKQKLIDIPDKTKLILVNNFDNPEVENLSCQAETLGAEVYRYPRNLGLAASWNLGLHHMKEDQCDFVIFLSASAVFDKSIKCFIEKIIEEETAGKKGTRYIASNLATMHCFAHTQLCLKLGGYFDENFWPIYYEDTDYCRRNGLNGVRPGIMRLGLDDVVHSLAYSISMRDRRLMYLWQNNAYRVADYYQRKWGGVQNSETFSTPFNNPCLHANYWKKEAGVGIWPPKVYEGKF
jgi:GT2 family glycosyltransferase